MSARSAAWYAVPKNRERRKENMRRYAGAMTRLAARHRSQYRQYYLRNREAGKSCKQAQQLAYAAVREIYRGEFDRLLADLRGV